LWQAVKALQEDQDGRRTISRDYEIGIELQKHFFQPKELNQFPAALTGRAWFVFQRQAALEDIIQRRGVLLCGSACNELPSKIVRRTQHLRELVASISLKSCWNLLFSMAGDGSPRFAVFCIPPCP
jgi:hypothetical protein